MLDMRPALQRKLKTMKIMKINKENKQTTMTYAEQRKRDLELGTRYGLRVEFTGDCEPIMALLRPWILSWHESPGWLTDESYVDTNGKYWSSRTGICDTDVKFTLKSGAPALNEIRWFIHTITDCHVAAQTVAHIDEYTGERMDYQLLESTIVRPNKKFIKSALISMARNIEYFHGRIKLFESVEEVLEAHMRNPEAYMRKEALRTAQSMIDNKVFTDEINVQSLADVFYKNMTFNVSGAHISMQMT